MFLKTDICDSSSDNQMPLSMMKQEQVPTILHTVTKACLSQLATPPKTVSTVSIVTSFAAQEEPKETPPDQVAVRLMSVAIEGLTDEELSDSGGEGMYRERDEFVVRNEDIEVLKVQPEEWCTGLLVSRNFSGRIVKFILLAELTVIV